jgi:uncharacterized protein (UPF0335 family)
MRCIECEHVKAIAKDPRVPPLERGECLCAECGESAYDERIEELKEELDLLRDEQRALLKQPLPKAHKYDVAMLRSLVRRGTITKQDLQAALDEVS